MHEQTFTIDFGVAGRVHFVVESPEALSRFHALGAVEIATGELLSQNQDLIDSTPEY